IPPGIGAHLAHEGDGIAQPRQPHRADRGGAAQRHHAVVDEDLLAGDGELITAENQIGVDLTDDEDRLHGQVLRWIAKLSTTRLMTPSSEGESGRRPVAMQRKNASVWPTSTSSRGASSSSTASSPGTSTMRSPAEARSGGTSEPTSTLRAPRPL